MSEAGHRFARRTGHVQERLSHPLTLTPLPLHDTPAQCGDNLLDALQRWIGAVRRLEFFSRRTDPLLQRVCGLSYPAPGARPMRVRSGRGKPSKRPDLIQQRPATGRIARHGKYLLDRPGHQHRRCPRHPSASARYAGSPTGGIATRLISCGIHVGRWDFIDGQCHTGAQVRPVPAGAGTGRSVLSSDYLLTFFICSPQQIS